jgi:hypothetical protein
MEKVLLTISQVRKSISRGDPMTRATVRVIKPGMITETTETMGTAIMATAMGIVGTGTTAITATETTAITATATMAMVTGRTEDNVSQPARPVT